MFAAEEDLKTGKWISEEIVIGNQSMCNNALQDQHAPHILSFGEDETGLLNSLYIANSWRYPKKNFSSLFAALTLDTQQNYIQQTRDFFGSEIVTSNKSGILD